jgi:hypothetical protein
MGIDSTCSKQSAILLHGRGQSGCLGNHVFLYRSPILLRYRRMGSAVHVCVGRVVRGTPPGSRQGRWVRQFKGGRNQRWLQPA